MHIYSWMRRCTFECRWTTVTLYRNVLTAISVTLATHCAYEFHGRRIGSTFTMIISTLHTGNWCIVCRTTIGPAGVVSVNPTRSQHHIDLCCSLGFNTTDERDSETACMRDTQAYNADLNALSVNMLRSTIKSNRSKNQHVARSYRQVENIENLPLKF